LRYNNGKLDWSLIDYKALTPMIRVLMFGSKKYTPDNWKKGMPREQILNSAMRHLTALMDGEEIDPESGLPHIGHLMCNGMFYSFFQQGLGSEKAMEFFNQHSTIPKYLKQYPVTVEEANSEDLLDMYIEEIYFDKDTIKHTFDWVREGYLVSKEKKIATIKELNKEAKYVWLNRKEVKKLPLIKLEYDCILVFRNGQSVYKSKDNRLDLSRELVIGTEFLNDIYSLDISIALLKEDYDKHFGNATT